MTRVIHESALLAQPEGGALEYLLRRSARRTMALVVDRRGVRVNVPLEASNASIAAFVARHSAWIRERLARQAELRDRARVAVADGTRIALLGSRIRLRLDSRLRSPRWRCGADGDEELLLPGAAPLAALERALRQRALAWLKGRVEEFCHRLGTAVPRVGLSSAATRWGSCSRRSGIRLHWKLVLLPAAVADYVVAHEVAHLREMNHSTRFWAIVAGLCPDWQARRAALREQGARLPEFVLPERPEGAGREEGS